MRRKLPPLIALRVFECAARHSSFTRAADELCVTQAAVSHQIKALEEWLGVLLFKRLNRSIKLTDAGEELAGPLTHVFDVMAEATGKLLAGETGTIVRIATLDSFASAWIMPRLAAFRQEYPDIGLRFISKLQEHDALATGDADLEIRYGDGDWSGLVTHEFLREDIFPVCSPRLLESGLKLETIEDLARFELIHDVLSVDWKSFLEYFDAEDVRTDGGIGFTHSHLVVQACIDGNGVALGRGALVQAALKRGDLVRPLAQSLPAEFAYYLVYRSEQNDDPQVRAFADWLIREAATEAASLQA